MLKRTVTGAFITAAVYLVLCFSHIPAVILCASAILGIFAVIEIYNAAGFTQNPWLLWGSITAAVMITAISFPYYDAALILIFPLDILLFGWMMYRQNHCKLDKPYEAAAIALAVVVLFRAVPELRHMQNGLYYLTGAVTLCFATDAAAYLIGRRFGRHKLLSKVSPSKTIEGAVAGVAASFLFMLLYARLLEQGQLVHVNYPLLLIYMPLASMVGQFGDLAMSVVKRICGIKDFGSIFPGHGGMLDRFDSHMFCVAFTLVFCTLTGGYVC